MGLALQIGLLWMSGRLLDAARMLHVVSDELWSIVHVIQSARTPRDAPKIRAVSAALAEINARENDIREQFIQRSENTRSRLQELARRVREAARRDKSTGDAEASANLALRVPAGI